MDFLQDIVSTYNVFQNYGIFSVIITHITDNYLNKDSLSVVLRIWQLELKFMQSRYETIQSLSSSVKLTKVHSILRKRINQMISSIHPVIIKLTSCSSVLSSSHSLFSYNFFDSSVVSILSDQWLTSFLEESKKLLLGNVTSENIRFLECLLSFFSFQRIKKVGCIPSLFHLGNNHEAETLSFFDLSNFVAVFKELNNVSCSIPAFKNLESNKSLNLASLLSLSLRPLHRIQLKSKIGYKENCDANFEATGISHWIDNVFMNEKSIKQFQNYYKMEFLFGSNTFLYEKIYLILFEDYWEKKLSTSDSIASTQSLLSLSNFSYFSLYQQLLLLNNLYLSPLLSYYHENNNSFNNSNNSGWQTGSSGDGIPLFQLYNSTLRGNLLHLINEILQKLNLPFSFSSSLSSLLEDCKTNKTPFSYDFMQYSSISPFDFLELNLILDFILHSLIPAMNETETFAELVASADLTSSIHRTVQSLYQKIVQAISLIYMAYIERFITMISYLMRSLLNVLTQEFSRILSMKSISSSLSEDGRIMLYCVIEIIKSVLLLLFVSPFVLSLSAAFDCCSYRILYTLPASTGLGNNTEVQQEVISYLSVIFKFYQNDKVKIGDSFLEEQLNSYYFSLLSESSHHFPLFVINLNRRKDR
jgi:hypothetical protein